MSAAEQWAWLARIRRTQGRKGEVFAEILTDFPEKFAERKHLWLLPECGAPQSAVELTGHWPHKGGMVLHFAGTDSISAAENLIGMIVAIPRAQRATLAPDEVYVGDLIGCTLFDLAGSEPKAVGQIEDVDTSAGPAPLLVVQGKAGEVLVPFAKSYLRRLNVKNKRVDMALPEGLVELNQPE
jgi:16S rRNA processing protein RimM